MYTKANDLEQARTAASATNSELRAGGTDLSERLRSGVSRPQVVDIGGLPGIDGIELDVVDLEGGARISALARVASVGRDARIQRAYPALALPAQTLATPQIRSMATMGGVLCQRTRCWYFRHPELGCPKKGNADVCPAREGNHRYGVAFDFGPCVHPHPSSIGCALLTYDASIVVAGRGGVAPGVITVAELYGDGSDPTRDHLLAPGEVITEIRLPPADPRERASYQRQMGRAWAEWPLVEVVVRLLIEGAEIQDAKVGIGGVANIPFRLGEVEHALRGRATSEETLVAAAARATDRAKPLAGTAYKLPMIRGLVLEALESAVANGEGALTFAV